MASHGPTFCLEGYFQLVLLKMEAKMNKQKTLTVSHKIAKMFSKNNIFLCGLTAKGILGKKINAS